MQSPVVSEHLAFRHAEIEHAAIADLKPYGRNARTHSRRQIKKIAQSIERFGFTNPVLVGDDLTIVAGHGRIDAAKQLGMTTVPILRLSHLNEAERRAYVLADNRLAEEAGWDQEILAIEFEALMEIDFNVEFTGFELAEIDLTLDAARAVRSKGEVDAADQLPEAPKGPVVSQTGDLWQLGEHRLLCGDARKRQDVERLVGGVSISLIFTDPPYNVPIQGHVSGLGKAQHREFAMASGEMSTATFTAFLTETLSNAASCANDGAIAYVCMDWRHMREMLDAGGAAFDELKNLCVWNKTNGGMGSFYRSKHELVFVWKIGTAPHTNSFNLGETGRYRTNVWDYAGMNAPGGDRDDALAMHPTVKPVALVADAIKDCSRRGDTVLDIFGGSGSTLIAAEIAGRKACLLEFDPAYCDVIIRRWSEMTGKQAVLEASGQVFDAISTDRLNEMQAAS